MGVLGPELAVPGQSIFPVETSNWVCRDSQFWDVKFHATFEIHNNTVEILKIVQIQVHFPAIQVHQMDVGFFQNLEFTTPINYDEQRVFVSQSKAE